MSVAAIAHYMLPDTAYAMWARGDLADYLRLPKDGTRVEVIGGEIVVSPSPAFGHSYVIRAIQHGASVAEVGDAEFRWRAFQTIDLNLAQIGDGYIPDLIMIDRDVMQDANRAGVPHLFPHQVGLVMEVTSPSNAARDRQPGLRRTVGTKWTGYAHTGIPFYLLVDRAPSIARTTLYGEPDLQAGTYKTIASWEFGETIRLPEPFGFEISTDEWEPWSD
jgi:Putative restriction endonuclease